jgi:hypothetical protein
MVSPRPSGTIAVGTRVAARPAQNRTGPIQASGFHLGLLTVKRSVGHGWGDSRQLAIEPCHSARSGKQPIVYDQPLPLMTRQVGAAIDGRMRQVITELSRVSVDTHRYRFRDGMLEDSGL